MKLGISIKIDVTKILKERLFKGQKGTYLNLTTMIDTDNADQYDNHGFIAQETSKEEREGGLKTPILGNCKVFYKDEQQQQVAQVQTEPAFDDNLPFQEVASLHLHL